MERGFHPISGEPVYMATEKEKKIIDVALLHYLNTELTDSSSKSGVNG